MYELVVIAGAWLVLARSLSGLAHTQAAQPAPTLAPKRPNPQLAALTTFADRLYSERKWLAAEKAYLNVLKIDHKNVTAYVHLGIIYSTQKNMPDAIECFQIATRLHPSGSTLQNLALAFYDNRNYIKSVAAYQKAIMLEPSAQRFVGLGKAHLKLKDTASAITAFSQAVDLEPAVRTLQRLADAYDEAERPSDAKATYRRIYELEPSNRTAARRLGIHLPT